LSEPARAAWSAVRQALERAGFRPSKRLGQNFLIDANLARAIARDSGVRSGDFVLEVGPGAGSLTVELLALGCRVLAVEIDGRLCTVLRELLGPRAELELVQADALDGKQRLSGALLERLPASGPWHLASNLPYSSGTPILVACSRLENRPQSMTALLQRELAQRISAEPGTKSWGAVTVKLQACYSVELVRRVAPAMFWPEPEVDSAVLRMKVRPAVPSAGELAELDPLVDALFQHRRQTLLRVLGQRVGSREAAAGMCAACGVDPTARPEVLGLQALQALARHPTWVERER
jgi:16S rRNA (adenine1518-N6/adenine1519-N6)-dimethyltransferase